MRRCSTIVLPFLSQLMPTVDWVYTVALVDPRAIASTGGRSDATCEPTFLFCPLFQPRIAAEIGVIIRACCSFSRYDPYFILKKSVLDTFSLLLAVNIATNRYREKKILKILHFEKKFNFFAQVVRCYFTQQNIVFSKMEFVYSRFWEIRLLFSHTALI